MAFQIPLIEPSSLFRYINLDGAREMFEEDNNDEIIQLINEIEAASACRAADDSRKMD